VTYDAGVRRPVGWCTQTMNLGGPRMALVGRPGSSLFVPVIVGLGDELGEPNDAVAIE